MKQSSNYKVLIYSDQHAGFRQYNFTRQTLWVLGVFPLSLLLVAGVVGLLFLKNHGYKSEMAAIQAENLALKTANDQYFKAASELESKLKLFDDKTTKLAKYFGVETYADSGGIGGPESFKDQQLNQYLLYDLGLLAHRAVQLENQITSLEEAADQQRDVLDNTPSLMPTKGWISSGFSYRIDPFTKKRAWHNGMDISCHTGTPIIAPANGVVSARGYQGGYGNMLELSHGSGLLTKYAHLSKFNVKKGQRVKRGDIIGFVGNTGRSTGPHLHYEVHQNGKALNPMRFIFKDENPF